jgi:hypothetical protein
LRSRHDHVVDETVETFARTGIVKIEGAFDGADAAGMRDVVWREMQRRYGIERDDPSTWRRHEPTGLKSTKRSIAFAPICSAAVADVLDRLLGAGRWIPPAQYGNVLVTMPEAGAWRVPDRVWHSDFPPTLPLARLAAVKLWALFGDVEPGGGGTPQLLGSHRAFARYLSTTAERDYKKTKHGFLRSHPWLRTLTHDRGEVDRNDVLMRAGADADGVGLRVVECTGRAGDVYVSHPWVFHSIAKNVRARPRLMRSVAVYARAAG